jgi:hypothetical protein
MNKLFTSYTIAYNEAARFATFHKRDVGLEKVREFGAIGYRFFLLPNPENRTGRELLCEVVRPGQPEMAAQ